MKKEYEPAEQRIAKLEAAVTKQGEQIRTLVVMLSTKASAPFGSPWQRFLEGPDSGKFFNPTREFECQVKCANTFNLMWEAAGNNEAAQDAAFDELSRCDLDCAGVT